MGEARSYLELRGKLTSELARDRVSNAGVSIQIIMPGTDMSGIPQWRQVQDDSPRQLIEGDFEDIGLVQR